VGVVNLQGGGGVLGRLPKLGELLAARGRLRRLLRAWRPDVLHTHLLKADALGARQRPRRRRTRARGQQAQRRARAAERAGLAGARLLSARARAPSASSDHVARFVEQHGRVPRARIRGIYYGVDPDVLQPRRPRAPCAPSWACCRTRPCWCAWAASRRRRTTRRCWRRWRCCRARSCCSSSAAIPSATARRAQGEAASWASPTARASSASATTCPTCSAPPTCSCCRRLWEGLGLVFLEAMAVSLPTVATNVSASRGRARRRRAAGSCRPAARRAGARDRDGPGGPGRARAARRGGRALLLQRFTLPRMIDEVLAVYAEAQA
jgi:glycosyltransferase involved in cell wall biosynthesis